MDKHITHLSPKHNLAGSCPPPDSPDSPGPQGPSRDPQATRIRTPQRARCVLWLIWKHQPNQPAGSLVVNQPASTCQLCCTQHVPARFISRVSESTKHLVHQRWVQKTNVGCCRSLYRWLVLYSLTAGRESYTAWEELLHS